MKQVKLELQALRYATKVEHDVFTHTFTGTGAFWFNPEDLTHPKLILNFGKANELIYNTIKSNPVEFYYRSYANKYGKNVVPKDLIEYAYYQCNLTDNKSLELKLDFSENSLMRKYQGKPEVRVIDDLVFEDMNSKANSLLQCAFFHLYNTRLRDEKWALFQAVLTYGLGEQRISFDEFKDTLTKINVL